MSVSADGKASIYSSSQGQFLVRAFTAILNGLPQSDVRAFPLEIGGGFGGKTSIYLEPVAAALSRKSGFPVKMVMTRDEVMRATGPGAGTKSTIKIGAKKNGKIVAAQCVFFVQGGCAPGAPLKGAAGSGFGCYDIPNFSSVAYDVLSNRAKVAAYRAPGGPQGHFACECILDELAETLGMDPLDLREINAAQEGTLASHGVVYPRISYLDTLAAARQHPHYSAPLGKSQGRGVASSFWFNSGGQSSAQVNVTEDGHVVVTTGHPDVGGQRASIANICAELLGIDFDSVSVIIGDTATIGYSDLTSGSRVLFASSKAVTESVEKVIAILCERAAGASDRAETWQPVRISLLDGIMPRCGMSTPMTELP